MRLILADDHGVVRDAVRHLLADVKPEVNVVGEAEDAPQLIELLSDSLRPDIVLLDIQLGATSGFDVLATASDIAPTTRFVVFSIHEEPSFVRRAFSLGAHGYVLKSARREQLIEALETVHAGKRYVQAELAPIVESLSNDGPHIQLSQREKEVLILVARGTKNQDIASNLGISESTVKTHLKDVFSRWGVSTRAEAASLAIRLGLID